MLTEGRDSPPCISGVRNVSVRFTENWLSTERIELVPRARKYPRNDQCSQWEILRNFCFSGTTRRGRKRLLLQGLVRSFVFGESAAGRVRQGAQPFGDAGTKDAKAAEHEAMPPAATAPVADRPAAGPQVEAQKFPYSEALRTGVCADDHGSVHCDHSGVRNRHDAIQQPT